MDKENLRVFISYEFENEVFPLFKALVSTMYEEKLLTEDNAVQLIGAIAALHFDLMEMLGITEIPKRNISREAFISEAKVTLIQLQHLKRVGVERAKKANQN